MHENLHIVASGSRDGSVLLFDIRAGGGVLGGEWYSQSCAYLIYMRCLVFLRSAIAQ